MAVINIPTEWFDRSEESDIMEKTEGSFPDLGEKVSELAQESTSKG